MTRDDDVLRAAVIEILGASAIGHDDLAQALVDRGIVPNVRTAGDAINQLTLGDAAFAVGSGGIAYLPALVDGTTWTAWVDGADADEDFVRCTTHLGALTWWLLDDDVDLLDGSGKALGLAEIDSITIDDREYDAICGPPGWLQAMAGGWASVTVRGASLRWEPCAAAPRPTARQVEAIRRAFYAAAEHERRNSLSSVPESLTFAVDDGVVVEALVLDRDAFTEGPIAPVTDLFEAAGFELRDRLLAGPDFDWDALQNWQHANSLGWRYRLDEQQVVMLQATCGAFLGFVDEGDAVLGDSQPDRERGASAIAACVEDGAIASAFWNEQFVDDASLGAIERFVDAIVSYRVGPTPCGLAWLKSRCLDRQGRALEAEALLAGLVSSECEHQPFLVDAASFAADRSDAATAFRLLRQAGIPEQMRERGDSRATAIQMLGENLLLEVEPFARHRPQPAARRNDPCPCGSGRKYKACHLGREQHPLEVRAVWLYMKASRFLRVRHPDAVDVLLGEFEDGAETYVEKLGDLSESPFFDDLALHEGGVFEEFLAARNDILPAEEALLAAQWSLVERAVFEIRRRTAVSLTLRNLASGDEIEVLNLSPSEEYRPGVVLLGRPLPVGDSYRALGGLMAVHRAELGNLLSAIDDGDALTIAGIVGSGYRPPRLTNTDGEDFVAHSITWRVQDPDRIDAALVAAGFARDDEGGSWRLSREGNNPMGPTVVATLTLSGDELEGDCNSVERADQLLGLVRSVLPDAELLDVDRRDARDLARRHDPEAASSALSADDPSVREALAELMVAYEQKWLDESIPALGGRTPRDAAADPIGREELNQLLDSFPPVPAEDTTRMSADRLRAALEL